jgi:hypothetical protein
MPLARMEADSVGLRDRQLFVQRRVARLADFELRNFSEGEGTDLRGQSARPNNCSELSDRKTGEPSAMPRLSVRRTKNGACGSSRDAP